MALLQAHSATLPWQPHASGLNPLASAGEAQSMISRGVLTYAPAATSIAPAEPLSFRCRVGFHRWTALTLSLTSARYQTAISFCRDCPALRRPEAH